MKNEYLKNVVTLELNQDKCIGCNMCVQVCPHNVFKLAAKKAQLSNRNQCMECGACARNCPTGAITVTAGVGCAYAIIKGALAGSTPSCGCDSAGGGCCG